MRSQLTQRGQQLMLSVPPASLLNADNAGQASFALAWNGASLLLLPVCPCACSAAVELGGMQER